MRWILFVLAFILADISFGLESHAHLNQKIIYCYKTQLGVREGIHKYNLAFSAFNPDDFYKLFIDRARLARPGSVHEFVAPLHLRFDVAEPGYYAGMIEAFKLVSETIGQPLTLDLLIQLHDTAVHLIDGFQEGTSKGWGYLRRASACAAVDEEELLKSGILCLPAKILDKMNPGCRFDEIDWDSKAWNDGYDYDLVDPSDYFARIERGRNGGFKIRSLFPWDTKGVREKIEPFLNHYASQVTRVPTFQGKIMAIAELLRALEMGHFFPDGNQRLYAFLVLNKLLIENNIPPAILEDPVMFDGHLSLKQMAAAIQEGVSNFLENDRKAQNSFLNTHCQSSLAVGELSPAESEYFANDEVYQPLFSEERFESLVQKNKEALRVEIEGAIREESLRAKGIVDSQLLLKATLLGDEALVGQLLDGGCHFKNKKGPLFEMVQFNYMKGVKMVLDYFREHQDRQRDIRFAIVELIEAQKTYPERVGQYLELFQVLRVPSSDDPIEKEEVTVDTVIPTETLWRALSGLCVIQ